MAKPCDYRSRVLVPSSPAADHSKFGGSSASNQGERSKVAASVRSVSCEPDYLESRCDQRLVLDAKAGSRAAFSELWNLYSRRIFRTVLNITKNTQDAEDAMQDSFLRAFLAFRNFEGRSSFYSWMTRIAINSALGILRKRRNHPEVSLTPAAQWHDENAPVDFKDLSPDPEQCYDQCQRSVKLLRAVHRLPENLREAIEALLAEECSVKEVADRLNISEAAAKSRLFRARIRLGSMASLRFGSRA